jgi:hypothetical protein
MRHGARVMAMVVAAMWMACWEAGQYWRTDCSRSRVRHTISTYLQEVMRWEMGDGRRGDGMRWDGRWEETGWDEMGGDGMGWEGRGGGMGWDVREGSGWSRISQCRRRHNHVFAPIPERRGEEMRGGGRRRERRGEEMG